MNQAEISKLMSKLRVKVPPRLRKFRNPKGPEGRLDKLRKTVTGLIKHERIELNMPRADESRMYAERLISDAIRYGDCHKETMEMATYWLVEKQLVHKLFKVLVPRYENYTVSYTRIYRAPRSYPDCRKKSVLELRGNPYPSLLPDMYKNRNLIHNVLLDEAKKAYRAEKYAAIAAKIDAAEKSLEEPSEEPESKSELKPESESELKPESESELKPESESELKPESESELKPESESELKPESESESKPESISESKPESISESKPESKSESKPESKDTTS